MMPQKKNPDISELVRGKTGRVYGHLMAMLTTAKGLPLTYNKDLQEDKEGFFDAIDTLKFTLAVYSDMVKTMTVNVDRMREAVSRIFPMQLIWQITLCAKACLSAWHMKLSANAWLTPLLKASFCRKFRLMNTKSSAICLKRICLTH